MALNRNPPPRLDRPFSYGRQLGLIELHLDDLASLVGYLQGRSQSVTLGAGEAVADTAEDLRNGTTGELQQVAIQVRSPDIRVILESNSSSVITSVNEPAARRLVDDVAGLLRGRRLRWWQVARRFLTRPAGLWGSAMLVLIGVGAAASVWLPSQDSEPHFNWGYLLYFLVVAPVLVLSFRSDLRRGGTRIVPETRSALRAARRSNRSAATISVASAVIGALLGALITALLT